MNTNYGPKPAPDTIPPAAPKPKSIGKRAALSAALLVSTGLTLAGLGLAASATAQAAPGPAAQHSGWSDCWWLDPGGWGHHHHHWGW
jgi:hypothetical protein